MDSVPTGEERRLSPVTLAQRAVVSVPALIFILLPVFRSDGGVAVLNLVFAGLYAAVVVPWMVVHYLRFRYRITEREILIRSGVLTTRRRNIPVERIQHIEIEQPPIQRMTRTAKVHIYTAGSSKAEGMLDVVSLDEAHRIRAMVRSLQAGATGVGGNPAEATDEQVQAERTSSTPRVGSLSAAAVRAATTSTRAAPEPAPLFEMDLPQVALSGVFRFSLLYIALAFSALQYFEPDPERLFALLLSGPWEDAVMDSPWTAGIAAVLSAAAFGWLTGILVNINRYFGFRLTLDDNKLHRKSGLLSKSDTTVPLRRVQSLVVRTNPLMRRFGWYRLEVQTMGLDVKEDGHQVAVPFGRFEEVRRVASQVLPGFEWPGEFNPVSRLTVRRATVRYSVGLSVAVLGASFVTTLAWWALLVLPGCYLAAIWRYQHMGYAWQDDRLFVQHGAMRAHTWIIPVDRSQVFYTTASLFQRRLNLKTVYLDTAGASPVRSADLVDLPATEAADLTDRLYDRFRSTGPFAKRA